MTICALAGFTVALFLLYSKGFSQQFTLLLLPFVVLLTPTLRGALFASVLMVDTTLVEGYVWVNLFPDDRWLLRATVGVRTLLLVLFAVETASWLLPRLGVTWQRLKPAVSWGLGIGLAGLAVFGGYRLSGAYWEQAAARSPWAPAIQAIQASSPDVALLFPQQSLYEAVVPFTRPRPAYVLADRKLPDRVGPDSLHARLGEFTRGHPEVLLVTDAGQAATPLLDAIRRWLDLNYQSADARIESGVRLERYVARPTSSPAEPTVFGGVVALDRVEVSPTPARPGQDLRVRLDWRALDMVGRDYTVFVHLLDGQGKLVAQHDSPPLAGHYPTDTWRPGERIVDEVVLVIPPTLPEGDYALAIGLYFRPTMERLAASGGQASDNMALIGPVRVVVGR